MANIFQRLFDTGLEARYNEKIEEVSSLYESTTMQNQALSFETERLQESMSDLALRIEDLNWDRIDGYEDDEGFPLQFVKDEAEKLRPLLTINPTIKKAVNTRVGYIWGRGVSFEGDSVKKITSLPHNSRVLFDPTAYWKLEAQLATDGNLWAARHKNTDEVLMIPMSQIKGWVVDENDPTRVNYWYREYTVTTTNFATGHQRTKEVKVFYPAYGYVGTTATIDGIKVDRNYEVVHLAANRQEGWILGIPDLMAAMFWAKAHKELFESGTTYVKAQGKFASKVVAKTGLGAQNAAARIADAPRRDPISGEISDIGGTAAMSGGLDYQLMGKMSGGVDFEAFDPVAGLVAVGLGVPLDVLLGRSDAEEKSLEQSVVDEMNMRRDLWSYFFRSLFGAKKNVKVVWPKIKTEPEYRRIQAVGISTENHVLSREELRQLTLEGYGLEGDPKDLPPMEEHPKVVLAKMIAEHAATLEPEEPTGDDDALPEQGKTGKVGKLSTGKDAKDARDNGADRNVKNE